MIFKNREMAAHVLAKKLAFYRQNPEVIILGLARGGAVVAYHVAKDLEVEFNFLIPRKLRVLGNLELAMGAISEKGDVYLHQAVIYACRIPQCYIEQETQTQRNEIAKKEKKFRLVKPFPLLAGKVVIVVDDGVATGSTLLAELQFLQKQNVKKLVVAVPVATAEVWNRIEQMVDESVALDVEESFSSISQFYEDFSQVEDQDFLLMISK